MCPQLSQIKRPLVRIFIALKLAPATQYGQQFGAPVVVKIEIPVHVIGLYKLGAAPDCTVSYKAWFAPVFRQTTSAAQKDYQAGFLGSKLGRKKNPAGPSFQKDRGISVSDYVATAASNSGMT